MGIGAIKTNMTKPIYSVKELRLITYFGVQEFAAYVHRPLDVYAAMMEEAFITNDQTRFAKSLRKCMLALRKDYPKRQTEEWDHLIDI